MHDDSLQLTTYTPFHLFIRQSFFTSIGVGSNRRILDLFFRLVLLTKARRWALPPAFDGIGAMPGIFRVKNERVVCINIIATIP